MKPFIFILIVSLSLSVLVNAQMKDIPVTISLKTGKSVDALHFGQQKCGSQVYGENYVIIRGKYQGTVTEVKDYSDFEKIVLDGYKKAPVASIGNEHGTVRFYKKNGLSFDLEEAEIAMSCYGAGDLYNELTVKILNPITDMPTEQTIEIRNIQSILFK